MTVEKNKLGFFWYPGCSDNWWVPTDWLIYKFDCLLIYAQGLIELFRIH